MKKFEEKYYQKGFNNICGLDEAGRGCWAGPLVVAICVLSKNYLNNDIKDSKRINKKRRHHLFKEIINNAIYYDYIIYSPKFVDQYNPKQASIIGMKFLIKKANDKIDLAFIDGEKLENTNIPTITIIKGDSLSQSIAAASIIAKTIRDFEMDKIDKKYPHYDFKNNQGYGTKKHIYYLEKFGPIKNVHRFSYKPIKRLLNKNTNK